MSSSLKFGTSGLRGLATELSGPPAYEYASAFVRTMMARGALHPGSAVHVGRDLRVSSPQIAGICMAAIADAQAEPVDCGALPTPALAYHAMRHAAPAIMVTGSHIPADRNGLKFYRPDGEIDKADEAAITAAYQRHAARLDARSTTGRTEDAALAAYRDRYLAFFAPGCLSGLRIGTWQHSSVGRDVIPDLLRGLGAETVTLGRSETFVPIDTEALGSEDAERLAGWATDGGFDAIVSTDGDADRPLVADEKGRFVRGDLLGALAATWLSADALVVPITANSGLEQNAGPAGVVRTRVGSPFVIAGMDDARSRGARIVVGFEANGGLLLGSDVERSGKRITALPTRDAVLPILACLSLVAERGEPLSAIVASSGFRAAASDRLENVPNALSADFLKRLAEGELVPEIGPVERADLTDGVRLWIGPTRILHYRASGNAPELRCYVEAETDAVAREMLASGLEWARRVTKGVI